MTLIFRCLLLTFILISGVASAQVSSSACDSETVYCIDELNIGLAPSGPEVDRATPRATLETFLFHARQENWATAAQTLNVNGFDTSVQPQVGADLARKLYTVISRKAVIDWDRVIDRPDAMQTVGNSSEPMLGQPRKSILLWTLEVQGHPASIRLDRVQVPGTDAVWIFSRRTVGDVPALYAAYGPTQLERMLPDPLKQNAGFGFMWWEIIGLPMLLGLALACAMLVWRGLGRVRDRMDSELTRRAVSAARGPAATAVATGVALFSGVNLLVFSGQISTILTPIAWLGLLASGLWLVVNVADVVLDGLTRFDETDLTQRQQMHMRSMATRVAAARRAFTVAIVLIGGGVFLSQTNLFQNLGLTLLGTAGALTLVLGFAARRVLGNIMASLQIALNQSARIGDRIVFNEALCHVERINFTYVQLKDWDGTRLIVPVEEFVSTPFENWTMKDPEMLRVIKIKCAHDADVDRLRSVFERVVDELEEDDLGSLDKMTVRVAEQDVFGKEVWFGLPCADPNTSWDIACMAREKILAEIAQLERAEKVEILPVPPAAEAA
ncbi:mechanosensitive ion channel family protein [Dinoroseobacter sp. S124A]|uniref:mechanosensitive ion channel family protein n=1 Tax=Dinoroseobacter sp. S124A TaxID=3415128 RepID=UPI003C7CC919